MSLIRISTGRKGEKEAIKFLKKKGYSIVEQNYRCSMGEIDIIYYANNCLVFCEVKTRKSLKYGSPLSAVTARKQRKIVKVAQEYCMRNNLHDKEARFDVIGVLYTDLDTFEIEHIENAFDVISAL